MSAGDTSRGHAALDRLRRIAPVAAAANGPDAARSMCLACASILGVAGVSLMVMTDGLPSPLSSSGSVAARLEYLQHTFGEGPCVDAHETGRPVAEPDLARPRPARWSAFGPAALAAGAGALFAFPLRIGGARIGALTLSQPHAGDLSDVQYGDAQMIAGVVAHAILAIQAQAEPGTLSPELEALVDSGAQLHQAAGMVSVQLGVGVGDALVRIRAYAFSADRALGEIAADVVARRLRFDG